MRRVRDDLTAHCGGRPSITQRLLIERAVVLSLRVAQIDARILTDEPLTTHDVNYALAWNNSLRRTLVALSLEPTAARPMDPYEYARLINAEEAETAA
jgi:hypothetical protein